MNNSIVRQTVQFMKKIGVNMTEQEAYHELLTQNFIRPNGEPTNWAIEQGFIGAEYYYPDGIQQQKSNSVEDDSAKDPDSQAVLRRMSKSDFQLNEEGDDYYIDAHSLVKAIKSALHDNAISKEGRSKYTEVLNELEQQLN